MNELRLTRFDHSYTVAAGSRCWRRTATHVFAGVLTALLSSLLLNSVALAQPKSGDDPLSLDRKIMPILSRHCYSCHQKDDPSGNVDLASDENLRLVSQHRGTWEKVRSVLVSKEMPPDDARELKKQDRQRLIEFVDKVLSEYNCDDRDPATPITRRLTRVQYDHAIMDLTGLDLKLADAFSPDPISYGFAGIGSAMGITPVQVDQYDQAAKVAIEAILSSKKSNPKVYADIFGELAKIDVTKTSPDQQREIAQDQIRDFAAEAYRRPVDDPYLALLMNVYDVSWGVAANAITATADTMRAVLMSPRFFMRPESNQLDAPKPYLIDDYDLASRLSFFLWSSPPDDELLSLAADGKLQNEDTIREQTRRMLRDPRIETGLIDDFYGQWLQLIQLQDHQVDKEIFPEFDEELRLSMRSEVTRYLSEVIQKDRSLTELLDSDFTYVNRRLGEHYGLDAAELKLNDDQFRRIKLTDRRRGGLITTAALLTLQADPGRTNVPRRGNYLAGTFLGTPPPPPPPDVPELTDVADGQRERSLREMLEEHRKNPACANCHAKMDPLGFALENFDAIGRWRDRDAGSPIDASGELVSGERFKGPAEFKAVMLKKKEQFLRTMTENLIVFALGRGLREADQCVIRDAMDAATENSDRPSAIIETIVTSFPFRYRFSAL